MLKKGYFKAFFPSAAFFSAPHGVPAALPLTCDPAVRNAAVDVTDDVSSFHVVDHLPDFLRSEVSNTSMIDYWSLFGFFVKFGAKQLL